MIKEEKRRHLQQNALEKEQWQVERARLLKSHQHLTQQNDQLKASNQGLKNQLQNAKESVSTIENQVKKLRVKFDEELKSQKKVINNQDKKEKAKDDSHRERVKELKTKYSESQNELKQLQEKYKVDTARFQALLAGQRQTIDSQKEKIKQMNFEKKQEQEERKLLPPLQYNTDSDQIEKRFSSYYETPKLIPNRPKSAAGYTTASSFHSSNSTTVDNLPKIYLNSKSPKNGVLKSFPKPPVCSSVAKSQEFQLKRLQNKLILGQNKIGKFSGSKSMLEESRSKSPQMGDSRSRSILKRNNSANKHLSNLIQSQLGGSRKKLSSVLNQEDHQLPKVRSNSNSSNNNNNNQANSNQKTTENRGRQLYSVQIEDLRSKSTPKQRSSPLREPRKVNRINVPSIPTYSIDDCQLKRNLREQQLYRNLQEDDVKDSQMKMIKLKPVSCSNERNPDEAFTFALNSRDDVRVEKQQRHEEKQIYSSAQLPPPTTVNKNKNSRNLNEKKEKLKGVENEIFILQREIAGLNYLSRQHEGVQQEAYQQLREKQRRLDVVRLQRDGILIELF